MAPLAITVNPKPQEREAYEAATPKPATIDPVGSLGREDIATLVVNGKRYDNWLSVQVQVALMEIPGGAFALDVAEPSNTGSGALSWANLAIKPGDRAAVYLAGHKVVDGYIQRRATNMDAANHVVRVEGVSRDFHLNAATAKHRQFREYRFESIVQSILRDAGMPVKFRMEGAPDGIEKPFRNIITNRFGSVFANIARLAKMRGVYLYADADGNLVGTVAKAAGIGGAGELVEGHNILSANVSLDDETVRAGIQGIAQMQGSDNIFGTGAAEIAAKGEGGASAPWLNREFPIPGSVDLLTAQKRTAFAVADSYYTACDATVVVQGWRKGDGTLWKPTPDLNVNMPSFFPQNAGRMTLACRAVTFVQSSAGTTTVLSLCLRKALGAPPDPGFRGGSENLLEPGTSDAQPQQPPGD